MITWVLVVFFQYSYAGGAVSISGYATQGDCFYALKEASQSNNVRDALCLPKKEHQS